MKIKLAMLDSNSDYLFRVGAMFNSRFADKLEIYSFTDQEAAIQGLEEKKIDVFLASTSFALDQDRIPKRCGFAYLVDSTDISSVDGKRTVCKFQKGELIYKQVLSIYSEHIPNITGIPTDQNGDMKTIVFCSPAGGVGTSTVAAACAIALANGGNRVLYLSCEVYGEADRFFSCDGQFDFGDVIYAVKSNKTNRAMKLQSTVKQDQTGVSFYSSVHIPLDMMEMGTEDYVTLQKELKNLGCYDYVVMDMDYPGSQQEYRFLGYCNSVVVVSDCSEGSERKLERAMRAIQILDENSDYALQPRMWLLKNKSLSNNIMNSDIRLLGSIPMYQSIPAAQMARQLSLSDVFGQLM